MPCFYTSTLPAKIKNKKLEFVPPQFLVCVGRNEQVQTLDYVCLRLLKITSHRLRGCCKNDACLHFAERKEKSSEAVVLQ